MDKKVVVITGATAGIGRETADYFTKMGHTVYSLARRTIDGLNCISTDITDREGVASAFKQIIAKEGKIDILINNAGFGVSGSVEDTPIEDAKRIFDVNFFGMVNGIQEAVPYLRESGGGTIVNISSVAAPLSIPFQGFYSASKSAVLSLSEALRIEVAPFNIKVTCMLPGDVKTDFTAKRIKNTADNPAYGNRIARSVAVMEHDEQNGMPPIVIAESIYKLAMSKNPPVCKVGGTKYKVFVLLSKLLPKRLVSFVVGKLYG